MYLHITPLAVAERDAVGMAFQAPFISIFQVDWVRVFDAFAGEQRRNIGRSPPPRATYDFLRFWHAHGVEARLAEDDF